MKFQRYVTVLAKISNHNTLFKCKPPNELVVNSGFMKKKKKTFSRNKNSPFKRFWVISRVIYMLFKLYFLKFFFTQNFP